MNYLYFIAIASTSKGKLPGIAFTATQVRAGGFIGQNLL
jgi:hypothetical protein